MKLEDILQDVIVNKARAEMTTAIKKNIYGRVVFTQVNGGVKLFVDIHGLPLGNHRFYIHEYGPNERPYHYSDLESKGEHVSYLGKHVSGKSGRANFSRVYDRLSFGGPASILYKSIVIYDNDDNIVACGNIKEA